MTIEAIFRRCASAFPVSEAMSWIECLTLLDRFQGSAGLEQAALEVARIAREYLDEVTITRFPADGSRQFWTFRAPAEWTPIRASLHYVDQPAAIVSFPEQACSLAVNSAATAHEGVVAPLVSWDEALLRGTPRGSVLLVKDDVGVYEMIASAERLHAHGFVVLPARRRSGEFRHHRFRMELPANCRQFAFSVAQDQATALSDAARRRARIRASVITIETGRTFPVVSGRLAGSEPEEALLIAHLCHPRPGANDNASGVAALLALGAVLRGLREGPRLSVRFLWGPEFVATAAYLHEWVKRRESSPLRYVLNMDMIGEDQRRCGSSLIIEAVAPHLADYLTPIAEHVVDVSRKVSRVTRWQAKTRPLSGTSDHALFADRSIAVPALQVGHSPDRYNHTSADTLDKVDRQELRRCGAIVATLIALLSRLGSDRGWLYDLLARRAIRRMRLIAREALPNVQSVYQVIEPRALEMLPFRLRYAFESSLSALDALASLRPVEPYDGDLQRARERIASVYEVLRPVRRGRSRPRASQIVRRKWVGPFNLRAVEEEVVNGIDRAWLARRLRARITFSTFFAIAMAIDDHSSIETILERAAFAIDCAINRTEAVRFLSVLLDTGWIDVCEV